MKTVFIYKSTVISSADLSESAIHNQLILTTLSISSTTKYKHKARCLEQGVSYYYISILQIKKSHRHHVIKDFSNL